MPIPAIRVKQTTSTTGTGTLTLNAASSDFRSWTTGFGGSSVKVRYTLSRSGVYEEGYGIFNGSTTLTRDTVTASSSSGSLVSLAAGNTDVFFDFLPGDRQHFNVTGTATLALADIGDFVRCTPTADMTLTLPAVATVPPGMGYLIKNDGTNNAVIWIDPNASETIEGSSSVFPLFGGEAMEVFSAGTSWRAGQRPTGWRQVGRAIASSSASIDWVLPIYISAASCAFKLLYRHVRPATDGATLLMRTSNDAGASYAAGASDYVHSFGLITGAATWAGNVSTSSGIILSTDADRTDAGNTCLGEVLIFPGNGGIRYPYIVGDSITRGNSYANHQRLAFGGARVVAEDINAIRVVMDSGDISLGSFTLYANYD